MSNQQNNSHCSNQDSTGTKHHWPALKKALAIAGCTAAVVTVTVVVTLTATHTSAVTQNAIAYVNGYKDGLGDRAIECLLENCMDLLAQ